MSGHVLDFYMYTYSGPTVHVEPMLRFMSHICCLGAATGLPIGICWNDTPREVRYSATRWERFLTRVRDGVVQTCLVVQFARPSMSMVAFSGFALAPFSMDAYFVPAGGIPSDTRSTSFALARAQGMHRYPTGLHLKITTGPYEAATSRDLDELFPRFGQLVTEARAALAWVEEGVMDHDCGTVPSAPELFDDTSLAQELDRRIPGVFCRMYLGPAHIGRLGGKDAVFRAFSDCHLEDLSSPQEDRICIQLAQDVGGFSKELRLEYHSRFSRLLADG